MTIGQGEGTHKDSALSGGKRMGGTGKAEEGGKKREFEERHATGGATSLGNRNTLRVALGGVAGI